MRKRIVVAGVLAVLALIAAAYPDRGAPPVGNMLLPKLEAWQLIAAAETGGVVCSHRRPCDATQMDRLTGQESACMWTGRLWLSSGTDHGLVLRSVRIAAYVVATLYNETGQERASHIYSLDVPWKGGWWWRAESERVIVSVPLVCDTGRLMVALTVKARSFVGQSWSSPQTVEIDFKPRATT